MKIKLEKNQNIFFTSDSHYNHSNLCRSTSNWSDLEKTRDFSSLDKMNQFIVDRINSRVGENDILVHLGDFSFGGFGEIFNFRNKIKCKNIHLILGNHDHHIERDKEGVRDLFSSVNHYSILNIQRELEGGKPEKISLVACHFPISSWDGMSNGRIHIHGHVHLNKKDKITGGRSMDVGADGNDLEPYSLDEILEILKERRVKRLELPFDHHEV